MRGSHENRIKSHWPDSMYEAQKEGQSESWSEVATGWERELEHRMGDHPKLTLAVAATLGFVLGWMVKRR